MNRDRVNHLGAYACILTLASQMAKDLGLNGQADELETLAECAADTYTNLFEANNFQEN